LLRKLLSERILVIDGAMGTQIQTFRLKEADYRGDGEFKDHPKDVKGNNELLVLTKPEVISAIHKVQWDVRSCVFVQLSREIVH
jgi:5-methyltetrahydrofolate--homocysteine methyltransferase